MPVRKNGSGRKSRMLDLWCTVFWPLKANAELAACAEIFVPLVGNDSAKQSGGSDAVAVGGAEAPELVQ